MSVSTKLQDRYLKLPTYMYVVYTRIEEQTKDLDSVDFTTWPFPFSFLAPYPNPGVMKNRNDHSIPRFMWIAANGSVRWKVTRLTEFYISLDKTNRVTVHLWSRVKRGGVSWDWNKCMSWEPDVCVCVCMCRVSAERMNVRPQLLLLVIFYVLSLSIQW